MLTLNEQHFLRYTSFILATTETQPVSDYIVVANELYIHQLSLDGSREKTLISGLGFSVALDYDFRSIRLNFVLFTFEDYLIADNITCTGQTSPNEPL